MSLPWGDPQFWVVTAAAAGGVASLVKPLLPGRRKGEAACGNCAAGAAACTGKASRERLAGSDGGAAPRLRVLQDNARR